jgi:LemA protein
MAIIYKEKPHKLNSSRLTMMILIVGGLIFGLLFLFFVGWFFSTWNRLVSLEENVNQSWANIDVLLRQRYDMLPNLERIVSKFVDHEKEIFGELAKARQMATGALQNKDVKGVGAAEAMMSSMIPRITAIAEAYPELKSDSNFIKIQDELVAIENQVADRREMYNSQPTAFNKTIQMIPTTFVASIKGCQRKDLFEVQGFAREAPVLFQD